MKYFKKEVTSKNNNKYNIALVLKEDIFTGLIWIYDEKIKKKFFKNKKEYDVLLHDYFIIHDGFNEDDLKNIISEKIKKYESRISISKIDVDNFKNWNGNLNN